MVNEEEEEWDNTVLIYWPTACSVVNLLTLTTLKSSFLLLPFKAPWNSCYMYWHMTMRKPKCHHLKVSVCENQECIGRRLTSWFLLLTENMFKARVCWLPAHSWFSLTQYEWTLVYFLKLRGWTGLCNNDRAAHYLPTNWQS